MGKRSEVSGQKSVGSILMCQGRSDHLSGRRCGLRSERLETRDSQPTVFFCFLTFPPWQAPASGIVLPVRRSSPML